MGREELGVGPQKLVEGRLEPRERARGTPDDLPARGFGVEGSGRPATPQAAAFGHPASGGGAAARQPRPAAGTATPGSSSRTNHGLFKAVRTSSGSLTGLLKRPGTVAEHRGGSPLATGCGPAFELRGAALLPPEPPRPAPAATPLSRASTAPHPAQQPKGPTPTFNIHARAGCPAGSSPLAAAAAHAQQQQQQQHAPAVVAAHGLDMSPHAPAAPSAAASLAQQLQTRAAAAAAASPLPAQHPAAARMQHWPSQQQRQQQQQQQQQQAAYARGAPPAVGWQSSGPRAQPEQAAGSSAATTLHQNPLYASGSEPSATRRRSEQHQQQLRPPPAPQLPLQQQQPRLPPVRVAPPAAAATPAGAAGTPGASPTAHLQAASNMTLASDSRPVSPGPFSSALTSCTPADCSRPVSPHCVDSTPPTPGSFAPVGGAAAARAAAPLLSRSLPASPAPVAAAAAAVAAAASPPAGVGAAQPGAAFRLPIFNQEGRLVGYKQNSNLATRLGAAASSAPSSPSTAPALSADAFQTSSSQEGGATPAAPSAATPQSLPRSISDDFRQYAAEPCKGFSDPDNMVPGYVLGPLLGKGGFCCVRRALHEQTGQVVACKIIEKGKLKDPKDRDRVDRECRVMRNLSNHVGVVRLYECVETRDHVYVMMEAAARGSLLDYVRERKRLPEEEAQQIFQQLLHALQFCHRKDVVHRDVKLENILIDGGGRMRLIDFGLCGYYVAGKRLRCHCGSPSYAAPEIVARKDYLGPPVDVWSLGVVLFAMLAGYLPFHAKEKKALSEKILAGVYKPAGWMSASARDLIARMLTLDPEQRITLEEAWGHPWVASAPRWQPPGVGAGRLYRSLTDPGTGAVVPDEAVLDQLRALGADVPATRRALRFRECNPLTAAYHLLFEARAEAARAAAAAAAAAEREAAAAAHTAQPAAGAAADCQLEFGGGGMGAVAAGAGGAASGSSAAAQASSGGSSSLRGSGSPARPPTAAPPAAAGSPTRFGQEAAAAGCMSPRRPPNAAAGLGWSPFASGGAVAAPGADAAAAAAAAPRPPPWQHGPERDMQFVIKALHPTGSAGPDLAAAAAAAAAAGEPGRRPLQVPLLATSALVAAAAVVAGGAADGQGACATPKSPCLSPLPTVLSPKQLTLAGGGGEPSLPQAVPQAA